MTTEKSHPHFPSLIRLNSLLPTLYDENAHIQPAGCLGCFKDDADCIHFEKRWLHLKCNTKLGCAHVEDLDPHHLDAGRFEVSIYSLSGEGAIGARDMLFTRPITSLAFVTWDQGESNCVVLHDNGIRFSDLIDAIQDAVRKHTTTCGGDYQDCTECVREVEDGAAMLRLCG